MRRSIKHWKRRSYQRLSPIPRRSLPLWAFVSLGLNGIVLAILVMALTRTGSGVSLTARPNADEALPPGLSPNYPSLVATTLSGPAVGDRHQLTYQDWLSILSQEAQAIAANPPDHLAILAGDSISLWFPDAVLPSGYRWLNQGISGETSAGLLNRLDLFADTDPDQIFVMIGINDLIRGIPVDTVLANQEAIVQTLKQQHPQAEIIVQSILPHADTNATWEGRDRLLALPNDVIQDVNQQLRAIAQREEVTYLDLYPLFTDSDGRLNGSLSTDGLHLSEQGYWVWRSAMLMSQP